VAHGSVETKKKEKVYSIKEDKRTLTSKKLTFFILTSHKSDEQSINEIGNSHHRLIYLFFKVLFSVNGQNQDSFPFYLVVRNGNQYTELDNDNKLTTLVLLVEYSNHHLNN
jgi:hypothetical protein